MLANVIAAVIMCGGILLAAFLPTKYWRWIRRKVTKP